MGTTNVLTVYNGAVPFDVNVAACDLLSDLSVKDFSVVNITDNLTESNTLWVKVTPTLIRYTGGSASLTNGDTIEIRRKTPNNVVQPVGFGNRFSSDLWNQELERIIRWREEADLNGVGSASSGVVITPNNGDYNSTWLFDTSNPPTRAAVFNAISADNKTKNYLNNGQFKVWQRGVSGAITGAAATNLDQRIVLADQWHLLQFTGSGTSRSMTLTREAHTPGQTSVPGNPKFFLRLNVTSNGAPTGSFDTRLIQPVEDVTALQGRQCTLSVYARSSVPGKFLGYRIMRVLGTGGGGTADTGIAGAWLIGTPINTWSRQSITFTMPALTGQTVGTEGTDVYLVMFYYQSHVGNTPSNINGGIGTVDLSNAQLELGDTATAVEDVPFYVDLLRCMRYYQSGAPYGVLPNQTTFGGVNLQYPALGTGQWAHTVNFPLPMAFTPSISINDTAGNLGAVTRSGALNQPATVSNINSKGFFIFNNTGQSMGTLFFNWSAACNYF